MSDNESTVARRGSLSSSSSRDSDLPNFQYKSLNHQEMQIRLFKIDTASVTDRFMRGSLENFDLCSCPSFRAVSYEWGYNDEQLHIIVDGSYLDIKPNLMLFLVCYCEHIELLGADLNDYLWVDQICVDQRSTFERNHQVKLMSRIYSAAEVVLAWLGPGCEDSLQYLESDEFHEWCKAPALHLGHLPKPAEKFLSLS